MRNPLACIVIGSMILIAVGAAAASQLVYKPIDPAFGGDPLNGSWLLGKHRPRPTAAALRVLPLTSRILAAFRRMGSPTKVGAARQWRLALGPTYQVSAAG